MSRDVSVIEDHEVRSFPLFRLAMLSEEIIDAIAFVSSMNLLFNRDMRPEEGEDVPNAGVGEAFDKRGVALCNLQRILNGLQFLPSGHMTGVFDPQTQSSLRKLQEKFGLPGSGILDEPTRTVMNQILDRNRVEILKRRLAELSERDALAQGSVYKLHSLREAVKAHPLIRWILSQCHTLGRRDMDWLLDDHDEELPYDGNPGDRNFRRYLRAF